MTNRPTTTQLRLFPVLTLFALVSAASCESCNGSQGQGGGGPSGGTASWLVGRDSLMMNVDGAGRTGRYPLEGHGDLLAISCWGPKRAWVAGDAGTLLTTEDGGVSWRAVDVGTRARLRGVEMAEKGRVFVVGEEGVLRVSADAGLTWQSIAGPAVTWTAVAPRHDGTAALFTTAGGDIYRFADGALSRVMTASGGLDAIALSIDGSTAAAVGEGGAMLISSDGGGRWHPRATGTTRALHDVWLIGNDGNSVFAVGDGGVLVRGLTAAADGAAPATLGDGYTLRGLHLESNGSGAIVGDGGALFLTNDFGTSWSKVATGEGRDILSVDALGEENEHW